MSVLSKSDIENMEAKRDFDGLVKALSYEEDRNVQSPAVKALGNLGDPRATETLANFVGDPNNPLMVRNDAGDALMKIAGMHRVETVDRLCAILLRQGSGFVKREVAWILGKIGDARAVEALIISLSNGGIRASVAQALGDIGDARAVEGLLAILKDRDLMGHKEAIEALGKIGDARGVEALISVLVGYANSPHTLDWDLRIRAVEALGRIGGKRAVEGVRLGLKDPDSGIRKFAAETLGKMKS